MTNAELKERLLEACRRATAQGHLIARQVWGLTVLSKNGERVWIAAKPNACMCPMAAVLLGTETETNIVVQEACGRLGVTYSWVHDFVTAFDGTCRRRTPGARLARTVRALIKADPLIKAWL